MRFLPILLLLGFTVHAQQLPLETYTPANGLVDARVTRMFQDSRGRIFFLTREGFSIFDGQHFDNYGNEGPEQTGIINGIAEYHNGLVKLFSFDGNVYYVDGNKVTIDSSQQSLLKEVNTTISISPGEKIIATNYFLLKDRNGKYEKINPGFSHGISLNIDNIFYCKPYLLLSRVISPANSRIYLYDHIAQLVIDSVNIPGIITSATDKDHNIYMLYTGKWMKIDRNELVNKKIRLSEAPFNSYIPEPFKGCALFFDSENNLWLCGNDKGYCRIDPSGSHITVFNTNQGILGNSNAVFQDAEKNIWLLSSGNGVQKIQQSPLSRISNTGSSPLSYVRMINTDENKNLFINTINAAYLNDRQIAAHNASTYPFSFYWHNQLWEFKDYKTLAGSGGTVFHLENYIPGFTAEQLQLSGITTDKEGRLILSGNFLFIIDRQLNMTVYKPDYFCDRAVVDDQGDYWLFMRSNNVHRVSEKNGLPEVTYRQTIPDINPRYALQWDANTFIVGTRLKGIKIFSRKNGRLIETGTIDKSKGLSNNFVYTLLRKNDQLVAGTGTGLDLLTFSNHDTTIENLAVRNNIYSPFTRLELLRDSSVVCLTGDGQLFRLANRSKSVPGFTPAVYFKNILVNKNPAGSGSVFAYNQNNFFFSVSAVSFLDNKNIRFDFVLTGNEGQWQQTGNAADFLINNLLPGNYTLAVTIKFPGKSYEDKRLTYLFVISKPFWKQWWFITILILVALSSVVLSVRNYFRRQLEKQRIASEKQQAVEKERTRIATDMHDDFGASLSRIKFISEKMQLTKQDDDLLNKDLVKISAYSDEMAEKMNEIVWALNQRYDSYADLVSFCRSYASEYLQDKNIRLTFDQGKISEKKIPGEIRRNIFLVIKEALHNIVKHAHATEAGISFSFGNEINVSIADNGTGFDRTSIRPFANGIENMKKRMADVNGKLTIAGNNGTEIRLSVPI